MSLKVLINCLPPANLYMPSIGCEILNNYISAKNDVKSEVIYWNHLFQQKISDEENLFQSEADFYQILPFLAILTENEDPKFRKRILLKMQEINPALKSLGEYYYEEKLARQIKKINEIIEAKLSELITDDPLLFGISAKFDAWIPGIIIATKLKKIKPDIICVVGGIEEKYAANVLFQKYKIFDYAIWGEGEIPLSMLIEKIMHKENNYNDIPRLLYRSTLTAQSMQVLSPCNTNHNTGFLDLKEYPDIKYSSYFNYANNIKKENIQLPIEISRGCRWNRCNFCALSWGNLYRTQEFSNVIKQIKNYYQQYNIVRFFFVDNDIVGRNIHLFEAFLDQLTQLSTELEVDFDFHADILHLNFNKNIIKKLSTAGFKSIQIGYEGVSDSMLKKLNKSTTFAENLLFVKFAQKYDIEVTITGLIIGIPRESESDIYESVNNLHFLRFFLGKKRKELKHSFSNLVLFYETAFWKMLSETERKKYNKNPLNSYFPVDFTKNPHVAYSLFGQWSTYNGKWESFREISNYYEKYEFNYCLIEVNGKVNYLEYRENLKIDSITFDQPLYWDILKSANSEVVSAKKIYQCVSINYPNLDYNKLIEIVEELKSSYLLYSSSDYSKIVSIIDTERL